MAEFRAGLAGAAYMHKFRTPDIGIHEIVRFAGRWAMP
jgi:hypothetical protein